MFVWLSFIIRAISSVCFSAQGQSLLNRLPYFFMARAVYGFVVEVHAAFIFLSRRKGDRHPAGSIFSDGYVPDKQASVQYHRGPRDDAVWPAGFKSDIDFRNVECSLIHFSNLRKVVISLIDPLSGRHCHVFLLSLACELPTGKKSFWPDFSKIFFQAIHFALSFRRLPQSNKGVFYELEGTIFLRISAWQACAAFENWHFFVPF